MTRYVKLAAIAFVAWFLISQPARAAAMVHEAGNSLASAANSLATFVADLP